MSNKEAEKRDIHWSIKFGLPSIVIILWMLSIWLVPIYTGKSPTTSGEFGDMFGSLNSLFAGLAFAGLIIAIAYQKLELSIQREELQLQREELHASNVELGKQRDQLENQSNTLDRQNFESSFFRILELHNSITHELIHKRGVGRFAITNLYNDFINFFRDSLRFEKELTNLRVNFKENNNRLPNEREGIEIENLAFQTICSEFFNDHLNVIGHYFRNLYHLIRYVDKTSLVENKNDYIRIVRAQLSTDEICLLFYNCLSEKGRGFKPNIEKYSILHNMDKSRLASREHTKFYDENAFN